MSEIIYIEEIKRLLPHKYPMLLVDRVIDFEPDKHATGIKNLTINEEFFQGHFPEMALMPGVLICESMAQTAGILIKKTLIDPKKCRLVFFSTVDEVKFRKPVIPGDTLIVKVEKERSRSGLWRFSGRCYVNDILVAEGKFSLTVVA